MALNPKQQRFVDEYLIDLNATKAAERAGYSPKTAYSQAHDLLKKPEIQTAIDEGVKARAERTQITQDVVVRELARIGLSDIRKLMTPGGNLADIHDIDDDTARAVSSVEVVVKPTGGEDEDGNRAVEHVHKIKLWDKNSALEKLGKHLGMFIDRSEVVSRNYVISDEPESDTDDWLNSHAPN